MPYVLCKLFNFGICQGQHVCCFFLLKYLFLISQIEDMPTSSPEMFGAPPLPSTIREALHQRLDKAGGKKGFILTFLQYESG